MKSLLLSLVIIFAFTFSVKAQKCSQYEKGQVISSAMKSWFCMKPMMPEWAKMKPAEKAKFVDEYNKNADSGTEKPSYEGSYETKVNDVIIGANGIDETIELTTVISGVEYHAKTLCKGDTLFITRGDRFSFTIANGDTTGYMIMGVQAIPNKLKVGDQLPRYEDYSTTLPKAHEWTQKVKQITGYETKTKTYEGQAFDSKDYKFKYGIVTETRSEAIWEDVTVNLKMESQFVMQTKYYINASVVREEEISIDGKKYKAYVIESQKWMKGANEGTIKADNKQFQKTFDRVSKQIAKKSNKEIAKMGFQNEQGYMVTFLSEWFVPGLGVVKSEGYDLNGFLNLRTSLQSIK
jgi:hypothetical protein